MIPPSPNRNYDLVSVSLRKAGALKENFRAEEQASSPRPRQGTDEDVVMI